MEKLSGSNGARSLCLERRRCFQPESYRDSPPTSFLTPENGGKDHQWAASEGKRDVAA